MPKIVVEKNEAVADLIERILENEAETITLVIPKKSHLLDSPNNFRLLAREAQTLNKNIEIESVDEKVLELAKVHGLISSHPLFDERLQDDGQAVSDIVMKKPRRGRAGMAEGMDERAVSLKVRQEPEELDDAPAEESEVAEDDSNERYDTLADYREPRRGVRIGTLLVVGLILAAGLLWAFGAVFGKADVSIRFQKTPWTFNGPVAALTSVKNIDTNRNVIPGQLFEEEKSLVQSFPASGRANVNTKAQGTITVVNAYSSDPQTLVARTRFQTPDGKVYRLDNQIVVPGAQVVDGKITPQSIKTSVTADQAGPSYNSGPVQKLTIPGFQGSPKFDGFYGVLENGISGGATGDRAVATDQDVQNAEAKVSDTLKSAFKTTFLGSIPADIKVLDGASAIQSGKMTVNRTAGDDGQFTVTGTAIFEAFGFREKDLNEFLVAQSSSTKANAKLVDADLKYTGITPDFANKQLKFSLAVNANLVPDFDPQAFAGTITGKSKADARASILALPDLADAQIKLWPAWLWSIPGTARRVNINVQ